MKYLPEILQHYRRLKLKEGFVYSSLKAYALVYHSCSIEGATLTKKEVGVLLEQDVTPEEKPLEHSLMVKDHFDALQFVLEAARQKRKPDLHFIQALNAQVMQHTGSVYQTVFGEIDGTKGLFRKGNVSAGGSYFLSFDKVPEYTRRLADHLCEQLEMADTSITQLRLSFLAHFDLVSIHPFYDGNGRTSRLLMNFIQAYFGLPLGIVYQENKIDYYKALTESRKQGDTKAFEVFMIQQFEQFSCDENW